MSRTMSIRLSENEMRDLQRYQRRFHQPSLGATLAFLLREKLREEAFAHITFVDTMAGRTATVTGTGLAVWEVMMILRAHVGDTAKTASHLNIPEMLVIAARSYRDAFAEEVDAELAENDAYDFERLQRELPGITSVYVTT